MDDEVDVEDGGGAEAAEEEEEILLGATMTLPDDAIVRVGQPNTEKMLLSATY